MCILIWIKSGSDVTRLYPLQIKSAESADLFLHGTCGVLNYRSLSYPVRTKSALSKGLKADLPDV